MKELAKKFTAKNGIEFDYKVKRFRGLYYGVKYLHSVTDDDTLHGEIISQSFKTKKGVRKWLNGYMPQLRKQ